jgi:hypothetical protein
MDLGELLKDFLQHKQRFDNDSLAQNRTSEGVRNEILFMFAGNSLITGAARPQSAFAKMVETYIRNPEFSQSMDSLVDIILSLFPVIGNTNSAASLMNSQDRPREIKELQ